MVTDSENSSPRVLQLRESIQEIIPCVSDDDRSYLARMKLSDVISAYMNWIDRKIPPRPRQTMVWDGFWSRGNLLHHGNNIDLLIQMLRKGDDMTPYLSRHLRRHGYERPRLGTHGIPWQGKRGGHIDFALNAFDLHHLHLKPCDDKGRRPGGSKELLYVKVSRKEALLLMLGDHNSFDDGTLLQAISDYKAISGDYLYGITGVTPERSIKETGILLRNGINSIVMSSGNAVPTSMLSSIGTSIEHTQWADIICETIDEIEPNLDDSNFRNAWEENYQIPATARLRWFFNYGDFGVLDENLRVFWPLHHWRR